LAATVLAFALAAGAARAEGALRLYNWHNYTPPELIAKFEAAHQVKVEVTGFQSPAEALEKIRAGGHGFDLAVLPGEDVARLIDDRLALRSYPNGMPNFGNVLGPWRNPPWDPWRRYSVPWHWGGIGILADSALHAGEADGAALIFAPPEELRGRIQVAPDRRLVIGLARLHLGLNPCAGDTAAVEQVRALLTAARPGWRVVAHGLATGIESGETAAALYWNEPALHAREAKASLSFTFPGGAFPTWSDDLVALRDAPNPENAKLFLDFVMAPENAALMTIHNRQANGIRDSATHLPPAMREMPEIAPPPEAAERAVPLPACPASLEALDIALWDELTK